MPLFFPLSSFHLQGGLIIISLLYLSWNDEHMIKTRILPLHTQVCVGSNEIPNAGETHTYFQSPILFSPISLLEKTQLFLALLSSATPRVTQNPRSEDK